MKINCNYEFKGLDGKVIPEQPDEEIVDKAGNKSTKKHPPFKLKTACVNVLLRTERDDDTGRSVEISGEEKLKRYQLAMKIYNSSGLLDLRDEERLLVKSLIAKFYPPLTVGQAWLILDPEGAKENEKE